MKQLKSIILLMMVALLPMPALAEESGGGDELDIPEIVLEHLADAYEWHIASYEGKHLSIPLPIIIRSENTGEWHFTSVRLIVCPRASSSAKSITVRFMSVWLTARRHVPLT